MGTGIDLTAELVSAEVSEYSRGSVLPVLKDNGGSAAGCMDAICPEEVINEIDGYYRGGVLSYGGMPKGNSLLPFEA